MKNDVKEREGQVPKITTERTPEKIAEEKTQEQEFRMPDASLILIKSIPIALFIVLVTLGIAFIIIKLIR